MNKPITKGSILFLITEDWFFCSHFLERALAAYKLGYKIYVCCNGNKHIEKIEKHSLKFIKVKFNRKSINLFYELKIIFNICSIYKKIKPDIVHQIGSKPIIYGSIAAKLSGIRAVINAPIGMGYVYSSNNIKARILKPIVKFLYKTLLNSNYGKNKKSRVIFENDDDLNYFYKLGALRKEDAFVIRGAGVKVDPNLILKKTENSIPIVSLVARMVRDKGIYEFVRAAKKLNDSEIKARFFLVGDIDPYNPTSLKIEELKRWHERNYIEWLGWVNDVNKVLKETDILCLPSYREGLPKALIEGASLGLPIVTTNTVGCKDVVVNNLNGFLVPIKDTNALVKFLSILINDSKLREKMGKESHKLALNKFSSDIIIPQTIKVYDDLI